MNRTCDICVDERAAEHTCLCNCERSVVFLCTPHAVWMRGRITCPFHGD